MRRNQNTCTHWKCGRARYDCRMNKVRAKVDQREKGVQDAAQSSVGTRRTTAKGDEVQVGCRGISRTRRTDRQRSASWDFDNKPIAVRARGALRDVEQQSVLLSSSRLHSSSFLREFEKARVSGSH